VTIIAGFKCFDGVVICGDTQETVSGLSKRNVSKIKVRPNAASESPAVAEALGYTDLAMAFGGAGDGPLIDKLIQRAIDESKTETSLEGACERIEAAIKMVHHEFGQIFQSGQCPSAQLIYGVKYESSSRLFSADGPIVNEVEEYYSIGSGYYMADFLASRMFGSYSDVYQGVILAAYILHNAKEHVDGCGGQSHIAVLREGGKSGLVDQARIDALTKLTSEIDWRLGHLLLKLADLRKEVDKKDIDENFLLIGDQRKFAKEDVRNADILADHMSLFLNPTTTATRDDLGFPQE
jgi:20S proteasome alpha/beta subunit